MSDNQQNDLTRQYQEILEKYAAELKAKQTDSLTPDSPPAIESTPLTSPAPEFNKEAPPSTPVDLPPVDLTPPPIPPVPPSTNLSSPASENIPARTPLTKMLFTASFLIFVAVASALAYTRFFAVTPRDSLTPPVEPTAVLADKFCELNDQKYSVGESFPSADGCNSCSCTEDQTIACTEKACDSSQLSEIKSLIPPLSQSPAAGVCSNATTNPLVIVVISIDNVPQPSCVKVKPDQKLVLINNSSEAIPLGQYAAEVSVQPAETYQFKNSFQEVMSPGVHKIGPVEIWLQ